MIDIANDRAVLGTWETPAGNVAFAVYEHRAVRVEWECGLPGTPAEIRFYYSTIQPQLVAAIRRHLEITSKTLVVSIEK